MKSVPAIQKQWKLLYQPPVTIMVSKLSTQFAEENKSNRKMLLSRLQLLARQGLAIRGDGDECMQILSNCSSFWDRMMSL